MNIPTAYFAGVGTVIVAVAVGLGGGYFAANVANTPAGVSKLERRMSAEPISVAAIPAQPASRVVATSPAATPQQPSPSQPVAEAATPSGATSPSTDHLSAAEKPAGENVVAAVAPPVPAQPAQPAFQPANSTDPKPAEQTGEKATASREVYARARDGDVKRADAEKRRAERRQAWAERRRVQPSREQELEAVAESVREVTEPRRMRVRDESELREMLTEPTTGALPRIGLFGRND